MTGCKVSLPETGFKTDVNFITAGADMKPKCSTLKGYNDTQPRTADNAEHIMKMEKTGFALQNNCGVRRFMHRFHGCRAYAGFKLNLLKMLKVYCMVRDTETGGSD